LKLNPFRKNNNKEIGSRLDINYDIWKHDVNSVVFVMFVVVIKKTSIILMRRRPLQRQLKLKSWRKIDLKNLRKMIPKMLMLMEI
jgi:hypothetical protein